MFPYLPDFFSLLLSCDSPKCRLNAKSFFAYFSIHLKVLRKLPLQTRKSPFYCFFLLFIAFYFSLFFKYSSIPFAPAFPAPIASITVAAPVTASPPANTPSFDVCPFFLIGNDTLSAVYIKPFVVDEINGFGEVPKDMITVSTSISYSEPSISTGLLLPEASGSPSSIFTTVMPLLFPLSSTLIFLWICQKVKNDAFFSLHGELPQLCRKFRFASSVHDMYFCTKS